MLLDSSPAQRHPLLSCLKFRLITCNLPQAYLTIGRRVGMSLNIPAPYGSPVQCSPA